MKENILQFTTQKSLKLVLILVSITILFYSCNNATEKEIDDEVVLKIGDVEITRYEFERNKERYFDPSENYRHWVQEFIEDVYFITDAMNIGYDTMKIVNEQVYYTSLDMISKVGGYVWNEIATPILKNSKKDIKDVYNKQDKVYYIEYAIFPNKDILIESLNNDTIIESEYEFVNLTNIAKSRQDIRFENVALLYPFNNALYPIRNEITTLEEGELSSFYHLPNGILIAHISKIEPQKRLQYKVAKHEIDAQLSDLKIPEIVRNKQKEIFAKAEIKSDKSVISDYLMSKTDTNYKVETTDIIAEYTLYDEARSITVYDFNKFLRKNLISTGSITSVKQVHLNINNIVIQQYLYIEANNLGILDGKKYQLDRRNFKNRFALNLYLREHVKDTTPIKEEEILEYYNSHTEQQKDVQTCFITEYIFKDYESAVNNEYTLRSKLNQGEIIDLSDSNIVKGLIGYESNKKVEMSDLYISENMKRAVFNAELNEISGPHQNGNQYSLFYKTEEQGERVRNIDELREEITSALRRQKKNKARTAMYKELLKKYPSSVNTLL
jgi:hypothetical protein